ncbi:uncharacterized protein [Amphiura filiformis]|uniref:uncharacterized protein n=1 Tax=Amphiura filiformis TaxID=82378 RepID=UPI003B21A0DF
MRLMACFGIVVFLIILDSLSKALATAEESKRNSWLKGAAKHYGQQGFERELRWNSPRPIARIPRTFDDANLDDKYLQEINRRAWEPEINAAFFKRSDDKQQRFINAVMDILDARSTYNTKDGDE